MSAARSVTASQVVGPAGPAKGQCAPVPGSKSRSGAQTSHVSRSRVAPPPGPTHSNQGRSTGSVHSVSTAAGTSAAPACTAWALQRGMKLLQVELLLLVVSHAPLCSVAEEQEACSEGWAGEECDQCAAGYEGDLCLPAAGNAGEPVASESDGRVHMLATICGGDYVDKCLPMLRSLLFHRTTPLTLHIIADRPARRKLARVFKDGWGSAALEVDYIHAEEHVNRVHDAFPANFFTNMGACSTLRMFAADILPSVEKAIIMDTGDVVLMDDVAELWGHFDNFDHNDLFGASKEQARWYYRLSDVGSDNRLPWNRNEPWYDPGWVGTFDRHGINAGVLLLHLERMRATGWLQFAEKLVHDGSAKRNDGTQLRLFGNNGEQDVYNLAVIRHPLKSDIVYKMPCRWNVQLISGAKCLDRRNVLPGLDDFNCSCMPPKLLHGNGGSFTKPNNGQGHEMAAMYRYWRDTPPDMVALGAQFVPQPLQEVRTPLPELGLQYELPS